jgi:hypothetical protein
LSAAGADVGSGQGALVIIEFLVLIGNDVKTPIALSTDFKFNTGYATVASRADGEFTLDGYCMPGTRLVRNVSGFQLYQNRPNPVEHNAGNSTIIEYHLGADAYTSLCVYDAMGRRVATLVDDLRPAGVHRVTFDTAHLPGGLYYYTLTSGTFNGSRKLLITR